MRIGIVNDLKLACEALRRAVTSTGQHEVAWLAFDGAQAVEMVRRDRPDLVLMDLIMPRLDGAEATRQIMGECPCPILVVTSTVTGNINKVYEAMGHGAIDAVETPQMAACGALLNAEPLIDKIGRIERLSCGGRSSRPERSGDTALIPAPASNNRLPRMVLIGASTGGPRAVAEILSGLPATLPAAVVIAQHVDEHYAAGLATWLAGSCKLPVSIAVEGAVPVAGRVYVASSAQHLTLRPDGTMRYTNEPEGWYRPSIDALFHSAVRNGAVPGTAVLLTGMGNDGAAGMGALRRAGWYTIAQDKGSSVVWGMPRVAIERGAAVRVLPAVEIAQAIVQSLQPAKAIRVS